MNDADINSQFIDQLALQTRLLRSIQTDMGEIRLQYTQTKNCESFERQSFTKAIDSVASSTRILADLILEYRDLHTWKNKKYIAVARGKKPGIYTDVIAANEQIQDNPNRIVGAFDSYPEAQKFMLYSKYQMEIESKNLEEFEESKLCDAMTQTNL
jgi:hypothetical protein